jgi:hypothetical protein
MAAAAVPRRRAARQTPSESHGERPTLNGHGDRTAETANPHA